MPLPNLSHENLTHFNCPICEKWWSIGDAAEPGRDHWYCPWCGALLSDNPEYIFMDESHKRFQRVYIEQEIAKIESKLKEIEAQNPFQGLSLDAKPHEIVSHILGKINNNK
jgi:hypothetical protein